jgi:ADP-ribosylglycohydrolase
MQSRNFARDILFGVAVGDALGVPVEFKERNIIAQDPVTDMRGYGTHDQPPGTWSDDSSLTFCLAECLCASYDLRDLADRFINWYNHNYWTPYDEVFDVGIATSQAIQRLEAYPDILFAGGTDEQSNGNGSLMRILPLALYLKNKPIEERFKITSEVSSITHQHIRSVVACFIYLEYAIMLLEGKDKHSAYLLLQEEMDQFLTQEKLSYYEQKVFDRILLTDISVYPESEIFSSGYVLHSLEASLWCLLTSNTYEETVLKAVNLGKDTDTTGAIAGGLAGLLYGYEAIPAKWVQQLARTADIEDLVQRLQNASPPAPLPWRGE